MNAWFRENPGLIYPTIALVVGLLSSLIKGAIRVRTSQDMSTLKKERPRFAAIVVILGVIGAPIVDFLDAILALATSKWPGEHKNPVDTNYADIPPQPPPGEMP